MNLQLEKKLNHKPKGLVVGVDEAGRGSWAGPVVAAAVAWPTSQPLPAGLNDSKMITPLGRERLFIEVAKQASAVGVGVATAIEVDELGVGQATRLAMRRAVQQLSGEIEVVLVDGFWVEFEGLNSVGVIGGDGACGSIAAASIVAKVTRDRMMVALDRQYAEFGFAKHKGYGTGSHQEAIALHGLCDEHRRSFAPIRKALI